MSLLSPTAQAFFNYILQLSSFLIEFGGIGAAWEVAVVVPPAASGASGAVLTVQTLLLDPVVGTLFWSFIPKPNPVSPYRCIFHKARQRALQPLQPQSDIRQSPRLSDTGTGKRRDTQTFGPHGNKQQNTHRDRRQRSATTSSRWSVYARIRSPSGRRCLAPGAVPRSGSRHMRRGVVT